MATKAAKAPKAAKPAKAPKATKAAAPASKLSQFLEQKKIDPRRILVASRLLERLRRVDRKSKLDRRLLRKTEDGAKKLEGPQENKPRSGRPVTRRAIDAAIAGKPVTGPAKTRILRALNKVLEQKKQERVDLRAVFELPSQGNPPKPKKEKAAAG